MSAASEPVSTVAPTEGLSERDREILAFERQWWKYAGSKETAIKELFDMSSTRYYQVLNALIDHPAALEHDPMLVKRLRRDVVVAHIPCSLRWCGLRRLGAHPRPE